MNIYIINNVYTILIVGFTDVGPGFPCTGNPTAVYEAESIRLRSRALLLGWSPRTEPQDEAMPFAGIDQPDESDEVTVNPRAARH